MAQTGICTVSIRKNELGDFLVTFFLCSTSCLWGKSPDTGIQKVF